MKKNNGYALNRRTVTDQASEAMEQMELYCVAHPRSPSAQRRPRLFVRGQLWIPLLGRRVEEGGTQRFVARVVTSALHSLNPLRNFAQELEIASGPRIFALKQDWA
jgi:hypothetical protein